MDKYEKQAKKIMDEYRTKLLKAFSEIPTSASCILKGSEAILTEILRNEAKAIGHDSDGFRKRLSRSEREILTHARKSIDRFVASAWRLSEDWAMRGKEV